MNSTDGPHLSGNWDLTMLIAKEALSINLEYGVSR